MVLRPQRSQEAAGEGRPGESVQRGPVCGGAERVAHHPNSEEALLLAAQVVTHRAKAGQDPDLLRHVAPSWRPSQTQ
ncbi:hypothetical protein ACWCQ1_45335 [Streptomyces sp. NPDC002144]